MFGYPIPEERATVEDRTQYVICIDIPDIPCATTLSRLRHGRRSGTWFRLVGVSEEVSCGCCCHIAGVMSRKMSWHMKVESALITHQVRFHTTPSLGKIRLYTEMTARCNPSAVESSGEGIGPVFGRHASNSNCPENSFCSSQRSMMRLQYCSCLSPGPIFFREAMKEVDTLALPLSFS